MNVHRLGLVYFGFGSLKSGFNSEKNIRVPFQNDLIHRPRGLELWKGLSSQYPDRSYWYFGSTGGSSLW